MILHVTIKAETEALRLWHEWFEQSGGSCVNRSNASFRCECFFCSEDGYSEDEIAHTESCVYVRAKALLTRLEQGL